jgi:hypothetical protein
MWNRIRRTSGIRAASRAIPVLLFLVLGGCFYTFQAGAGLPTHVRTLAVVPFDNDTDRFEVAQELHQILVERLPQQFGVRTAGEEHADAVVRGTIRNYSVDAPSFRPAEDGRGAQVLERQVAITVHIEVVDLVNNIILWDNSGLSARGEFEEASQIEEDGRRVAMDRLVQSVIDGIQSNW